MRTSLLPLLVLLSGCFYRSMTVERGDAGQEIVLVTRGHGTQLGYIADRATETCWFAYGAEAIGQMNCCDTRKFKEITKFITWENDELCAARERARVGDADLEAATMAPKKP
jgi:hypothetical protein